MKGISPVRLAVIGAGLVGERHCRLAVEHPDFELSVIIDADAQKQKLANSLGSGFLQSIEVVEADTCDAAIIATPNGDHLHSGLLCLERRWPCLIEKPIADTVSNGRLLELAFAEKRVPLLIGHHRRYHPFVERARQLLDDCELGNPVAASIVWAVRKPDDYFRQGAWRLDAEGGPLLINLIHELDLILCLLGPVEEVQAMDSNHQRKGRVEDTAGILLRHKSGMLTTVTLTDCGLSPWSFEGATGENPNIADTGISSWRIICTMGSFEFPSLHCWQNAGEGEGDWSKPLEISRLEMPRIDPLHEQLTHFARLSRGETDVPVVSGRNGLEALHLLEIIKTAIRSGSRETVSTTISETMAAPGE